MQPGVRNLEAGLVDRPVAVDQDVEVERPRTLVGRGAPVPAEGTLELEDRRQEVAGRKPRLELHRAVQETRLVDVAHRLRVTKARDSQHLSLWQAAEPPDRSAQGSLTVAEIRAEADKGADHAQEPSAGGTLGALARRLLILLALFLASAVPARADLVQLSPAHAQDGARLARSAGGTEIAPEVRIWSVPTYAVADLRRARVVQLSRPDRQLPTMGSLETATDPLLYQEWWRAAVGADRVDAPGPGKPVTVVDSGVDMSHAEFASRPNTTVLNTQTTKDEDEDHGTEVASVLAAPNNGVGLVGVYPDAALQIWDASPFGILNESAAIQGIVEAARRGPGVINLSFGGEDDDPLLEDAILFAIRSGSLVVAAAGNSGFEGSPRNYPAAYPHVLTVGATNETGRIAGFSTVSSTTDLAAPGVSIWVAEPISADPSGYIQVQGTSFASPLVAGAAAWVWTSRPDLDNTQLFELMRRSATDIGPRGFDNASGYGLLDIPRALTFKTPLRDPFEPNEAPADIEPHRLFGTGVPPLTQPGKANGSLTASVDRSEDPVDLYRVWAPAREILRARVTGLVAVRLLPRSPRANNVHPLAVGNHGLASYRNQGSSGAYVYVEVRPTARFAEYRLRLTAARR